MKYIKENLKEFEICNITKWHGMGYTGKGIKVAEIESCIPDLWFFHGMLKDPFDIGRNSKLNSHGQKVLDVIHQVAPDCELFMLPRYLKIQGLNISGDFIDKTLKFATEENIHIINASLGGTNNKKLNEKITETQKQGTVFVTSSGNDGKRGLGGYAKSNVWISVGAVHLNDRTGNITYAKYSSIGKDLDFTSFSNLHVYNAESRDRTIAMQGTSFSSPLLSGMLALVQQFFKEKIGRTLYQSEIYRFIQANCIDLGEAGFDEYNGHGLFVLPDPSDINVNDYINTEIKMTIGSDKYYVNGIEKKMDTKPIISNDRAMIPVRFIAEELNMKVEWDESTKTVILRSDSNV